MEGYAEERGIQRPTYIEANIKLFQADCLKGTGKDEIKRFIQQGGKPDTGK